MNTENHRVHRDFLRMTRLKILRRLGEDTCGTIGENIKKLCSSVAICVTQGFGKGYVMEKEQKAELEEKVRGLFRRLGASAKVPDEAAVVPEAPGDITPHLKFIYETLNARIDRLDKQLAAIYRLAFRTSAALLGLALPALGPEALSRILRAVGIV
jgi:hypothetical protein